MVVRDADVEDVDDVLAEPRCRHLLEHDGVARGRLVGDQLVGGVDAELRLRRTRGGAAAQPGQLLAHQVLPLGLGRRGVPVTLDALQDVGRVAALERLDDAVVDLPGRVADLVEEPPVVGHDEQPAGVRGPARLEVSGQPGDALDVEVVGRLVEEQHVVVADQQRSQRDPAALATAEIADRGVPRDVGDESRDDVADLRVAGPLVVGLVADDRVADGLGLVEGVGLVEHPDVHAAAGRHAAGVGLHASGQDAKERRLAVAVAADDADPVTLVDADRHRLEDGLGREVERDGLDAEEMCHRRSLGG